MRVGIDIRVAAPDGPGQQRYLWRLGAWLGAQGHEVHFISVLPQRADIQTPPATQFHRADALSRRRLRTAITDLALDALLINPERSAPFRGIPANLLRSAYGTEQYIQKLRSFRNPVEWAARAALRATPWTLAARRCERAFYESRTPAPDVIAQSRYMRGEILNSYDVPDDHMHVVHNAVDTDEYTPEARVRLRAEMRQRWSIPSDALCLLFLGHNYRLKGLWQILDVLARAAVQGRRIHLLVAGRGTGTLQRQKAERLVRSRGLEGCVTFAGSVKPSLHALAAADALLHLSWHDSFGFVALEAMACGLPVVTTRWVGAAELIDAGVSGLLVDPADNRQVIAAIETLTDDHMRSTIGAAAARVASQRGEPANFAEVLKVLRTAVGRGTGPIRAL